MTRNSKFTFAQDEEAVATFCKALAHPARVAILKLLLTRGWTTFKDIVASNQFSPATVSQHMDALREAGLLREKFVQPFMFYSISTEGWQKCRDTIGSITGTNPVARKWSASIYEEASGKQDKGGR